MADNTSMVTDAYMASLAEALRFAAEHDRIFSAGFLELVDRVAAGEEVNLLHLFGAFRFDVACRLSLHTREAYERGFSDGKAAGGQSRADLHRSAAITGYSQRYGPEGAVDAAERVVQALRLRGLL